MIKRAELRKIATEVRKKFELGQVDRYQLAQLYISYNPIENIDLFVERASKYFPNLNCGLAALYLKNVLKDGEVVYGKYGEENHTFLLIDNRTIVDITADQYNGPSVYVGPVKKPWQIGVTSTVSSRPKSLQELVNQGPY